MRRGAALGVGPALALAGALAAQTAPAPYDDDPDHPANRVFRATFVVELVPAFVAAALPGEHGDPESFFRPGWYFEKRAGTAADRAVFGGDGRQMPRERFTAAESMALAADLAALDGELLAELRRRPRLTVCLQHDLLRLLRRLLDTKANPELRPLLLAAAERLALPAAALADPALSTFDLAQIAPHLAGVAPADLVEIDRRSTRLFDAGHTLLWSEVWVAVPAERSFTTAGLLAALAAAPKNETPEVPLGTTGVLVQGITALDDEGMARATDVVVDVRIQRFASAEPLGAGNPTTTKDGVEFLQWLLPRRAVRDAAGGALGLSTYRAVAMDTPELFRDYGSLKHTTYAAQCSLCHRRTNTPDTALAGFSALRPSAKPRVAEPGARRRLAERQVDAVLARVR